MPGGATAACIPDPAYPPPCPPVVVVHAAAASDTNANRLNPPSFDMRSSLGERRYCNCAGIAMVVGA